MLICTTLYSGKNIPIEKEKVLFINSEYILAVQKSENGECTTVLLKDGFEYPVRESCIYFVDIMNKEK